MTNQKIPDEKLKLRLDRIGNLPVKFYKKENITMEEHADFMSSEVRDAFEEALKEGIKIGEENIKKEWLNWLEFIEKNVIDCNIITEIGYKIEELQKGDTKQ